MEKKRKKTEGSNDDKEGSTHHKRQKIDRIGEKIVENKEEMESHVHKKKISSRRKEKQREKKRKKQGLEQNSNLLIDKKNLKLSLQKQLEFYFSKSNLEQDSFLQRLILDDKTQRVKINIIMQFNRTKELLKDIRGEEEKIQEIKSAISKSGLIGVTEDNKYIYRKICYVKGDGKENNREKRVIYVENFPRSISDEEIAGIFARAGRIMYLNFPKDKNKGIKKGYGFIEYKREEEAKAAKATFDNLIPQDMLETQRRNYIASMGNLRPLRVLNMKEWNEYKNKFKGLKQQIHQIKESLMNKDPIPLVPKQPITQIPTLIKLTNLPGSLSKLALTQNLNHFGEIAYLDYKQINNLCTLRFESREEASQFILLGKASNFQLEGEEVGVDWIEGKEKDDYLEYAHKCKMLFRKTYNQIKETKRAARAGGVGSP